MATRRTTFDKLQRERARRAKAAAKRERRQERAGAEEEEDAEATGTADTTADLLQRIEALHKRFDDGEIGLDDFEEQKADLFNRLAALPMD